MTGHASNPARLRSPLAAPRAIAALLASVCVNASSVNATSANVTDRVLSWLPSSESTASTSRVRAMVGGEPEERAVVVEALSAGARSRFGEIAFPDSKRGELCSCGSRQPVVAVLIAELVDFEQSLEGDFVSTECHLQHSNGQRGEGHGRLVAVAETIERRRSG